MKKALSIVLAMLMIFSTVGVMAFAEDEAATDTTKITYIFKVDDKVVQEFSVDPTEETSLKNHLEVPTKESTETTEYIFKGWLGEDGVTYYPDAVPVRVEDAGKTLTFVAQFSEKDITATQSFWKLVESIFARINLIFEYFAKIFEW